MNSSGVIGLLIGIALLGLSVWLFRGQYKPDGSGEREYERRQNAHQQSTVRSGIPQPEIPRTTIRHSEYLTPEQEKELLTTNDNGIPNLVLHRERGQIVMRIEGRGLVNPHSRTLWRKDIFSFSVRGSGHYHRANRLADTRPGVPIILSREPDNPHDKNAVSIYSGFSVDAGLVGYVNKQNAARLAPKLDAGEDWVGMFIDGDPTGHQERVPRVLITRRAIMSEISKGI